MNDLLETTHSQVKIKAAELRKSGELKAKEMNPQKVVKILSFDEQAERELLLDLDKNKNDFLQRHFILIALQDFYYKYRDIDNKYSEKCKEYCYMDIDTLGQTQKSYYDKEIKQIKQLKNNSIICNVYFYKVYIKSRRIK